MYFVVRFGHCGGYAHEHPERSALIPVVRFFIYGLNLDECRCKNVAPNAASGLTVHRLAVAARSVERSRVLAAAGGTATGAPKGRRR